MTPTRHTADCPAPLARYALAGEVGAQAAHMKEASASTPWKASAGPNLEGIIS